jgi:hypothetical protein
LHGSMRTRSQPRPLTNCSRVGAARELPRALRGRAEPAPQLGRALIGAARGNRRQALFQLGTRLALDEGLSNQRAQVLFEQTLLPLVAHAPRWLPSQGLPALQYACRSRSSSRGFGGTSSASTTRRASRRFAVGLEGCGATAGGYESACRGQALSALQSCHADTPLARAKAAQLRPLVGDRACSHPRPSSASVKP